MIAVELVVVAMLVVVVWFLTSRRTKGRVGEWMVGFALRGLDSREYRVGGRLETSRNVLIGLGERRIRRK